MLISLLVRMKKVRAARDSYHLGEEWEPSATMSYVRLSGGGSLLGVSIAAELVRWIQTSNSERYWTWRSLDLKLWIILVGGDTPV